MSLRIALVIDGETQGSAQALKDTEDGIKNLTTAASDASGEVDGISDGLSEVKDIVPDVADGITGMGEATKGAGTKFNDMKSLALGALGGIAGAAGVALVTAAITEATTAFINFVDRISSSRQKIEEDLKAHTGLIKDVKDAYDELDGGASSYGLNTLDGLGFESQQNITNLADDYQLKIAELARASELAARPSGTLTQLGGFFDSVRTSPYDEVIAEFNSEISEGTANVIEFRGQIEAIGENLSADDPFRTVGENLLAVTEEAGELQAELQRAVDLYKGLSGDAGAAATALGGSADGFDQAGSAAQNAIPFLREYDGLLRSIASDQSAASVGSVGSVGGSVQPFAQGGVVTQPTLFNFGADEVGLMGEAGDEAILPMTGGKVGALGTSGQEFRLGVTRLQSGEMGVQMPQPFALGGIVGGAVKQFASGGVVSSSAGSIFSGGFGQIGNQISNLISELFTGGQVTNFGGLMADQMAHESNIRDQLIAQSPTRIAALEAERTAIGNVTDEIEEQGGWLETGKSTWRNFLVEIGQATADGIVSANEWGNAISGAFDTLRDKAFALAADGVFDLIAGAFSGSFGGGGGNFFGDVIGGLFGFSDGGWTGDGPGTKGVVHGDEFVVRAGPAAANRSALEAMNSGASFGGVGSNGGVTFAPVTHIDARGSNMSEAQFNRILDQRDKANQAKFGQFFAEQSRRAVAGVV